jgi:hypothetical protein
MKAKKKIVVLTLVAVFMGNFCTVGLCMEEQTKKSIYLPETSWVIPKIEEQFGKIYKGKQNWNKEVSLGYSCIDHKVAEVEANPIKVFASTQKVSLRIPITFNFADGEEVDIGDLFLSMVITFDKPIDNIKHVMIQDHVSEELKYHIEVINPSSRDCKEEIEKMATKETDDAKAQEIGLANNVDIEIFPVSMGTYTWGYALIAPNKNPLFWCRQGVDTYEEDKFYELKEVLNSYWKYVEKQEESYVRSSWV